MALNREDILKQIEDNRKYYAGHAEYDHPGKEAAMAAADALAEVLGQIEKYDKFVSLGEMSAKLMEHLDMFPRPDLETDKDIEDIDMF